MRHGERVVDEEFTAHQLIDKVLLHQQEGRIVSKDVNFLDRCFTTLTNLAVLQLRVKSLSHVEIVTSLVIEMLRWATEELVRLGLLLVFRRG